MSLLAPPSHPSDATVNGLGSDAIGCVMAFAVARRVSVLVCMSAATVTMDPSALS